MARICYLVAEFIPIMSGVYLFTALYFLSKFKHNEYQLNLKAMSLHATSFGLYMVSDLLFIYAYIMYRYLQKMKYETLEICWGITYICSALSQAILSSSFGNWERRDIRNMINNYLKLLEKFPRRQKESQASQMKLGKREDLQP